MITATTLSSSELPISSQHKPRSLKICNNSTQIFKNDDNVSSVSEAKDWEIYPILLLVGPL